jgi:hypothetical protein
MPTKKIAPVVTVSQAVLDATPMRALVFLRGSRFKPLRAVLQRAGYQPKDHSEGWSLLKRSCGFFEEAEGAMHDETADAVKELDAWDEAGFRRARAALARLHPEQCEFVFRGGLKASQGLPAVMGVLTFLDRLDELETSPDRRATRKQDQAALATLAQRGFDDKERKRLRALVDVVQSSPELVDDDGADDARQQALVQLRAWFEDWSDTARSVVVRRDHLIRLGLAQRKANGKIEDVGDGEPIDGAAGPADGEPARPQSVAFPGANGGAKPEVVAVA